MRDRYIIVEVRDCGYIIYIVRDIVLWFIGVVYKCV